MNVTNSNQMQSYTQQMQMRPPNADEIFSKIMQAVDSNEDGSISSDELSVLNEEQQARLTQADSDGNGLISEDELLSQIADHIASKEQMKQGKPGGMEMPSVEELLTQIMQDSDTDGDGVISAEEVSALDERQQEKLAQADTDGDGIITQEELSTQISADMQSRADMPPPPPPPSQEMTMNSFKDMLVSAVESDSDEDDTTDTASQIQDFLMNLGLSETESNNILSLLENKRFDVTA
ncbi:EF-hand domain-containing protein [Sulfurimonas microaerophilic]|uniref:EF-hand domain-containing protein n=1 Tax=Sulfurimonas microaerophilic TaxID=3058392 RepID=UPI0027152E8C|nr:EF-hand domain-containing protein [Sulfurimonas sp. hsl 1-7]